MTQKIVSNNGGLQFYAQGAYFRGVCVGGCFQEGPGSPPWDLFQIRACIFMRPLWTLEGFVFEEFSKGGLGEPPQAAYLRGLCV